MSSKPSLNVLKPQLPLCFEFSARHYILNSPIYSRKTKLGQLNSFLRSTKLMCVCGFELWPSNPFAGGNTVFREFHGKYDELASYCSELQNNRRTKRDMQLLGDVMRIRGHYYHTGMFRKLSLKEMRKYFTPLARSFPKSGGQLPRRYFCTFLKTWTPRERRRF